MAEMKVERSVEIDAKVEQAWEWLADVPNWPSWKPFIISASYARGSNLEEGSKIKFKPKAGPVPMDLVATITQSSKPNRVVWQGAMPGVKAIHEFEFAASGNKTRVTTREKFTGPGVILFKLVMPLAKLEKLHEDWLEAFKNKASRG